VVGKVFADFLYPPFCLICDGRLAAREKLVCEKCWERARREEARPFYAGRGGILPEPGEGAFYGRSANRWNPVLGEILHRFKYGGFPSLSVRIARGLVSVAAADGRIARADLLVPVPLTRRRRAKRGFNQSVLLARRLSEASGIPVGEGIVRRKGRSRSQTRLDGPERWKNVQGVFRLRRGASLRSKRVVVIDDVMTSGATACGVAEELRRGGAVDVVLLCAARAGGWDSSS